MRRLLTGYAQGFNRRHRRRGHLFQNRYKSIVCEEDPYLLELVRYIHLNPLGGLLVKSLGELDRYPRSGHRVLIGGGESEWQERNYGLMGGVRLKTTGGESGAGVDALGSGGG